MFSLWSHFFSSLLQGLESRVFKCVDFVHDHKQHQTKLDYCTLRGVFMGYPPKKRRHKCYHPP